MVLTTQFDTNFFMSLAKIHWIRLIKSWLKLIFKGAPKIEKDSWHLRTIVYCIYGCSTSPSNFKIILPKRLKQLHHILISLFFKKMSKETCGRSVEDLKNCQQKLNRIINPSSKVINKDSNVLTTPSLQM